jgi:hypothetical protein
MSCWFHTAEALSIPYNGGMGSWVDPRAYLDIVARYKKWNFTATTGNEPWPPVAIHLTDLLRALYAQ